MIKKVTIVILLVSMLLLLCGCSSSTDNPLSIKETIIRYKAYIKINEETIIVNVKDYTFSSIGTIKIYGTDGKIYRTHWANVVLVGDTEGQ